MAVLFSHQDNEEPEEEETLLDLVEESDTADTAGAPAKAIIGLGILKCCFMECMVLILGNGWRSF